MRILAIETSGRVGSIALADGPRLLEELQFPHGLKHAAEIIPIIDRLCRAQGWQPDQIEHLYVSAGPGSFTGLRIGITLAKIMGYTTGVKIVAVPSVQVLVENAPPDATHAVIVLDAKRDQIYTARFERSEDHWIEREPAHLDSLPAVLTRAPRPVHLLGEGIPYHQKFIPSSDPSIILTPQESWRARAAAVAQVGLRMAEAGHFADPLRLIPIYIRPPEPEEKLLAAQAAATAAKQPPQTPPTQAKSGT